MRRRTCYCRLLSDVSWQSGTKRLWMRCFQHNVSRALFLECLQSLECFLTFLAYPSFFLFLFLFFLVSFYLYAVMLLETFFPLFCLLESLPMACFTLILVEHQNSYNPWLVHIHCVPCVPLTPHAQLTNNNQCQVAMSRMMAKLNRWQM